VRRDCLRASTCAIAAAMAGFTIGLTLPPSDEDSVARRAAPRLRGLLAIAWAGCSMDIWEAVGEGEEDTEAGVTSGGLVCACAPCPPCAPCACVMLVIVPLASGAADA